MSDGPRDDTGAASRGHARFHRFTGRDRCPHCDHDGPCISFDNGDILCHREGEPGNWTDSFIGGYWHRAEDATADRPAPRRLPASPSTRPSAPINLNKRHAIVADLLKMCPLSEAQCVAHHLTEAQASRYGWLPGDSSSQAAIIAALLHTYTREELRGVPGFREQNGNIKIRGAGMMLPTRDLDGKIHAIDLRRDTVKDGQARYYKLSSRTDDDVDAPSPGAPPHVAIPAGGVTVASVIGITEGVKKADYAADALGYPVISIPGIGSWRAASEVLERFAGSVVVLMLDQDDPAKAEGRVVADVERTRQALATTAFSLGYAVRLATWDHTRAKGIDDLLATGETFTIERYRPAPMAQIADAGPIAGITPAPDGSGLITIDPRLLAWLVSQTAATTELRLRYNYILAVARDRALNDGQKLTEIVLSSHLPAHRSAATAEPVTVAASTIARELGSKVTIQKDGKPRPTKLSTVTKNLADIITLGVRKRDEVISERVITNPRKRDKNGHPLQETIKVTNYAYHSGGSLPGERMDREQALAAETRAKVDRTRPRCSNCYSDKLKPTSHVCLKCGKVSSDVDAMRAGHELVDLGDGRFVHRDTGESIVPGVPVEVIDTHDWNPVMGSANGKEGVLKDAQDTHDWIPVTIEPCEGSDRNPVMAPMLFMTALSNDEQPSSLSSPLPHPAWPDHWRLCPGGCGIPQPHGSTCKACRIRQDSIPLHISGRTSSHDGGAL